MFQAFTMLHADSAIMKKVRLSRAALVATDVSDCTFLRLPLRVKLISVSHPQEWPSAKSSVPKEIADAKEDECAMCTATDPTTY